MPDKNLTDTEIKKALEICGTYKGKCTDCPAFVKVDRSNCKQVLLGALDIFNRLQAENKEWKSLVEVGELQYRKQKAEIEDLEKKLKSQIQRNRLVRKKSKTEAYKEFAEEIFELFPADKPNTVISRVTVKHILKKLVGEDK